VIGEPGRVHDLAGNHGAAHRAKARRRAVQDGDGAGLELPGGGLLQRPGGEVGESVAVEIPGGEGMPEQIPASPVPGTPGESWVQNWL
jgi:hypothetical protein